MVWQSPKSKIGFPLGGTWIVPGATASEIRSPSSVRFSSASSKRAPMRSESDETVKASFVRCSSVEALKRFQSQPGTKRKIGSRFAGLTQSCGAVHDEIPVAGVADL